MKIVRFLLIFGAIIWLLLQSQVTSGPELGIQGARFEIRTISGELVSSEDLLGRTVVLEFWATWCPACVSSLPALNSYRDLVADDPSISVFGVHVPKGRLAPSVSDFMTRRQYSFDVILDRQADLSRAFKIESIPTLIILGPDGRVRHVKNGAIGGSAEEGARRIEGWVAKALTDGR